MPTEVVGWIGQTLAAGRYQVTGKLGEGGMGFVYRAHDQQSSLDVVIKAPRPEMMQDRDFSARFAREVRSLTNLVHPHIVKILDVGEFEGVPFAVLQYLSGGSLRDRQPLNAKGHYQPLPAESLLDWLRGIAEALDFIHRQDLVHRDVKPDNILFDERGQAYLSDFGIAKVISRNNDQRPQTVMTQLGIVLGTPKYMAPEMILESRYDGGVDQYALAVVLFEQLSGRPPFPGPKSDDYFLQHAGDEPAELALFRPDLPRKLTAAVQKALKKKPKERFPNCTAFAHVVLDAVLNNDESSAGVQPALIAIPTHAPPAPAAAASPPRSVPPVSKGPLLVRGEFSGMELVLEGPPLGRGGEALIYAVADQPDRAAKIYHHPRPEHADKLGAMLTAPPADPMTASGYVSIAWPVEQLLPIDGTGQVIGYLMPRVHNIRLIQEFFNPKARLQHCPLFHYGYLLRTARNLAAAVRAVHERGYVIGDVNESNLLVSAQALVTLVDTDSFQVPAGTQMYRCPVGKPEYTPPELQGARFADIDRRPEHDAFGLSVLIFQLLMQGMHPFAGVYSGPGEPPPIPSRIAAGDWPYAQSRAVPFQPSNLTPPWNTLPSPVQNLLRSCFEEGHADPKRRPTAAQWQRALFDSEAMLVPCQKNQQHVFSRELSDCPWCALAVKQGRDPFPSIDAVRREKSADLTEAHAPKRRKTVRVAAIAVALIFIVVGGMSAFLAWRTPTEAIDSDTTSAPPLSSPVTAGPLEIKKTIDPPPKAVPSAQEIAAARIQTEEKAKAEAKANAEAKVRAQAEAEKARIRNEEEKARIQAEAQAQAQRQKEAQSLADRRLYLSAMQKIPSQWDPSRAALVKQALDSQRPEQTKNVDWRSFEWYFWHRRCQVAPSSTVKKEEILSGHTGVVWGVAVDAQGKRFATAGADKTVIIWDLATRRPIHTVFHSGIVHSVAFSPDGARLASASSDETVKVWDVMTGKMIKTLADFKARVGAVTFSRDGLRLAAATSDGQVRVWDAKTFTLLALANTRSGEIFQLAYSPEGKLAAAMSGIAGKKTKSGLVKLFDSSLRELWSFPGQQSRYPSVAFSPDGAWLAVAGTNFGIEIRDTTGAFHRLLNGHRDIVTSLAFSPNGARIASASADKTIRIWDRANGVELRKLAGHSDSVRDVDFTPDGQQLLSTSNDGSVRIWDLSGGPEYRVLTGHQSAVQQIAFNTDGTRLASASADHTAKIWNTLGGPEIHTLRGHTAAVQALAFNRDGTRIATGGADRLLLIWDAFKGERILTLTGHQGAINDVVFSPDRAHLASASEDGAIMIWKVSGEMHCTLWDQKDAVRSLAYSPDGTRLASGGAGKRVMIWDAGTGRLVHLLTRHTGTVTSVAFSPDGKQLASASDDRTIKIWDAMTGGELHSFQTGNYSVSSLAFSSDGMRFVTAGSDQMVRLCDGVTGMVVLTLGGHTGAIHSVSLSPDGGYLASGSADKTIHIWDASSPLDSKR